ncbi:hypothetical protein [Nitrosopumilus piranensis]|uniref:Uncharacterized protein n=1 Tax=Nitrosopumilus piranensis TaxID=1582439 RepID=A0A0C5C159_9ARCH|nr:hypothetical protein [Nitrosopumilus piranensis]AJM93055.1 membrane protein of unknown function [Nitrosopumilus piranensis]
MKINVLFLINLGLVVFFSIGAAYFTLLPMVMLDASPDRVVSAATQNFPMIGLWLIYFANIVFLPLNLKRQTKKLKIVYVAFLLGITVFVVIILSPPIRL